MLITIALGVIYGLFLLRWLHFIAATAIFVFAFVMLFEYELKKPFAAQWKVPRVRLRARRGHDRGRVRRVPVPVPGESSIGGCHVRRTTDVRRSPAAASSIADSLFDVLWSTQLGIIVGMLPGLTATMGIALMTTLTFKMAANNAIIILICMYIGAIYGGQPQRDPAEHPRHSGERRHLRGRLPAGQAGTGGPGHRHRHDGLVPRLGHRHARSWPPSRRCIGRQSPSSSRASSSSGSRSSASSSAAT